MKAYTLDLQFYLPTQQYLKKTRSVFEKNIRDFRFWNSFKMKKGITFCCMKKTDYISSAIPQYRDLKKRLKKLFKEVKFDVIRIICNLKN